MRIINLQADNFKRLKAVEITPKGPVVEVTGRNANGKQQPISEPVLTPHGWKPIGTIKVGDYVIGSNGSPTKVIGVFPQKERRTFRLTVADGGTTRCGPDHLWTVSTWCCGKGKANEWKTLTMTTLELLGKGIWRKGGSRRWALPNLGPVQFEEQTDLLPISPYALGVILGDGHIEATGYVTVTSADQEILDRLDVRSGWFGSRGNVLSLGTAEWSRPLTHLGLSGKRSFEKFVPSIYMMADVESRRSLLAGLMDTDGTPTPNWAEYSTASPLLAEGVANLARSLGYIANINIQTKKYTYRGERKEGLPSHLVRIRRGPCPFNLLRKTEKWKPSRREDAVRFIDSIEPCEDEDSVCIMVEARDGLYVTNDFLVTHNTSVLDAIWAALGGASHIQAEPIRKGATKAKIKLSLGEITVTRSFTKGGTSLVVEDAEGGAYKSPQKMLDELVGALSFDPLEFSRMKARDQYDTLKKLAHVDLDLDKLDAQNRADYQRRTDINRDAKTLSAQADGVVVPDAPSAGFDTSDLTERLHVERESLDATRNINQNIANVGNEIGKKRAEFQAKREALVALKEEISALEQTMESLGEVREVSEIESRITDLETSLQDAARLAAQAEAHKAALQRRQDLAAQAEAKEKESEALTAAMEARTKAKQEAIAKADMPIPGLSFGDGTVLYNEVPFEQASSAERLRVSTAIAMAANPKLRVIRIEDGSLLDDQNMAMLAQMAKDNDFQVWIEVVDASGKVGIYIEDGEVKADNQQSITETINTIMDEAPGVPLRERDPQTQETVLALAAIPAPETITVFTPPIAEHVGLTWDPAKPKADDMEIPS